MRTTKGAIVKSILLILALLDIKFLVKSIAFNLAHEHFQWLLDAYPGIMCALINQRMLQCAILLALIALLMCEICIIMSPFGYHSLNHDLASFAYFFTLGGLVLIDFVLKHIFENGQSCKTFKVNTFVIRYDLSMKALGEYKPSDKPLLILLTILVMLLQMTQTLVYHLKQKVSRVGPAQQPPTLVAIPTISSYVTSEENRSHSGPCNQIQPFQAYSTSGNQNYLLSN